MKRIRIVFVAILLTFSGCQGMPQPAIYCTTILGGIKVAGNTIVPQVVFRIF